ncbi:MAG: response regulator transcription factor [Chloroflexi bacterium]|nr:response regulator transcription factor [Chloroflexota bacterium]
MIRVLIADDHEMVRQGLLAFLNAADDLEPVGEATNGQEAAALYAQLRPDVVLIDMVMPHVNGVEGIKAIRQHDPDAQIIALTSFSDNRELVQAALQAGANGYLFKDVSVAELAQAIRHAYDGKPTFAPGATKLLIQASTQPSRPAFHLTERELDVLTLMAKGLNNPQIAEQLTISRSTVKFHVSSILGKLGVESRTEAVSIAHQHHLVR